MTLTMIIIWITTMLLCDQNTEKLIGDEFHFLFNCKDFEQSAHETPVYHAITHRDHRPKHT